MSDQQAPGFKPKKSVALSGVTAGNTALCTVGKTGNDLHYRGYDILDVADSCEFEEIAHLLVHGKLPTAAELRAYKAKLKALRGLPANVKAALEWLPAASHPMDVMRTGVSALGCVLPEKDDHNTPGARDIADRLMASLGSMLLYWYHYSHNGNRIEVETDDDSIGAHFLHLLHGEKPSEAWEKAMHTSLILYAEHEFNASTFTGRVIAGTGSDMYSAITGAIGALRGPKHGGANEVAFEIQKRYDNPDEAEADIRRRVENKEVVIGFGHPVYTISDPRNKVIKEVARKLSKEADVRHRRTPGNGHVGHQEDVPQPGLVLGRVLPHDGRADGDVYAAVRHRPHLGLGGAHHRAAHRQQDHPPLGQLRGTGRPEVRADQQAQVRRGNTQHPRRSAIRRWQEGAGTRGKRGRGSSKKKEAAAGACRPPHSPGTADAVGYFPPPRPPLTLHGSSDDCCHRFPPSLRVAPDFLCTGRCRGRCPVRLFFHARAGYRDQAGAAAAAAVARRHTAELGHAIEDWCLQLRDGQQGRNPHGWPRDRWRHAGVEGQQLHDEPGQHLDRCSASGEQGRRPGVDPDPVEVHAAQFQDRAAAGQRLPHALTMQRRAVVKA
ncbi:hypothetical protein Lal_00037100 [Lupinus albus]|nr:hypothetical protein Lal_00037100 [Lupinus albus]